MLKDLIKRIERREAKLGVVGVGYVGLPLAVEFAKRGFNVTGFDVNQERIDLVSSGTSYIQDIESSEVARLVEGRLLSATSNFEQLKKMDAISICVPTPLGKTKDPDMSYVMSAAREIAQRLRPGQLVVLESTTYPGTTNELILPELESSGLRVGQDFFLAFSPERVDPGNKFYKTSNTPKIIGGVTNDCLRAATALYSQAIERIVPVASTKAAEMVKLLENTFRAVNIGLVNEVAIMCDRLNVDVWEVIEAASTKPFGFMGFYPGPGLGGHCIPVDVHYLSWKLKTLNYKARFIELASEINSSMPNYVVHKVIDSLNCVRKSLNGSRVFVIGVTYKKDTADIRESPALDIMRLLLEKGAVVGYHDPYIKKLGDLPGVNYSDLSQSELAMADCAVIVTDHSCYNYQFIVDHSKLVVDTRNATKWVRRAAGKVVKL